MSNLKTNLEQILLEKQTKIIPENIKKDIEIFDVIGIYGGIDTSDATASVNDILSPKTAYIAGGKVTGSIEPKYATTSEFMLEDYSIDCDTTNTGNNGKLLAITKDNKFLLVPALTESNESGLGVFSNNGGVISLIKAYSFSELNMVNTHRLIFSLSDAIEDDKYILWYSNNDKVLRARIIDFSDRYTPISEVEYTYTVGGVIKSITANPKVSNSVLLSRYVNDYVQHISSCRFNINTKSINLVTSEIQLNIAGAGNSYPIYISSDGTKAILSGTHTWEAAYNAYLFSLDQASGAILSRSQFNTCGSTGLSPDGNYAIVNSNLYKLNGTSYTFIGTTVSAKSDQYGYMFVIDSSYVCTSNDMSFTLYEINTATGKQKSVLLSANIASIANNVINQNELCVLSSDKTKIQKMYSDLAIASLTRSGITYVNTSDATATVSDIASGKTAYVNGGKITGTLTDIGANDTVTGKVIDRNLTDSEYSLDVGSYTDIILRLDGQILCGISVENVATDIGLTSDKIKSGETILGLTGTVEDVDDFIVVPEGETALLITDCIKQIPLLNTSSVTNMSSMFNGCTSLTIIPLLDTSSVTDMSSMFRGCTSLTTIPLLDTSSVTTMSSMFLKCTSLSNDSLNNLLQMCINAVTFKSTKSLRYIGLSEEQAATCTTLSNYQAFLDAGWTTGY